MLITYKRILFLLNEKGISQAQFCKVIGINRNTLLKWEKDNPGSEKIVDSALFLEVSTDYLLGLTDDYTLFPKSHNLSPEMADLLVFIKNRNYSVMQSKKIKITIEDMENFN